MKRISLLIRHILLALLEGGLFVLRPLLGPRGVCRFTPTCSQYAKQAILQHGIFKGTYLSVVRICKCHPCHPGGYDPVPVSTTKSAS